MSKDYVLRIRNHPSIGLYCGRNEGIRRKPLDEGIEQDIAELHPGLHYIPNSASAWSAVAVLIVPAGEVLLQQSGHNQIHSELGMPNIITMDSVRAMMPESGMWPQGATWGMHDFSLHGAQGGQSFRDIIDKSYGGANNVEDWVELAQFVNYEGYRAMFEAQSKNRMGVLLWMSHSAWPSFVWQTYDYYFEPAPAISAARKARSRCTSSGTR